MPDVPNNEWIIRLSNPIMREGYILTVVVYGIPEGTFCYSNASHSSIYDFMLIIGKKFASNPPTSELYTNGSFSECNNEVQLGLIKDFVEKLDGLPCIIWCYGKDDECIYARGGVIDLTYAAVKTCATMENIHGGPIFKVSMN
jgi:hypothetical protein